MRKFKFLTGRIAFVAVAFMLFSCSKDEGNLFESDTPIVPGIYIVDATKLDDVSVSLISYAAQIAGYPQLASYLKYDIELYKIIYNTTYKGQSIPVSGLISYPLRANDSLPTLIVGNGLVFANEDAPSEFDLPDNFIGFEFLASLGFVVLIPDMIGFGVSSDLLFPIHNYEHSALTMIDCIYAGEEFIQQKNLKVNNIKFLTGYSQGGHVAMSALKMIEETPFDDIKITASAIGAGGFNLVNLLQYSVDRMYYSAPSHLIMLFSSYNEIYEWNRPMTDFFQEPYAGRIPVLLNGEYNREEIDQQLAYSFDSLMNPDFINDLKLGNEPELMQALADNCVDDWAPESPLQIIHSINDDRIPLSDSEDTYNKMVSNGAAHVTFVTIETVGHVNAAITFVEVALDWFESILTAR